MDVKRKLRPIETLHLSSMVSWVKTYQLCTALLLYRSYPFQHKISHDRIAVIKVFSNVLSDTEPGRTAQNFALMQLLQATRRQGELST
jgi:hypothetical protein